MQLCPAPRLDPQLLDAMNWLALVPPSVMPEIESAVLLELLSVTLCADEVVFTVVDPKLRLVAESVAVGEVLGAELLPER